MERRRTLLLVDDEDVLRGLVSDFLRRAGYSVVEAADGLAALDRFDDSGPIDMALVDLNLPGCLGHEVCAGLRRRRADLPILVVSAALIAEQFAPLEALGLADILTKPYHPETLLVRIRQGFGEPSSERTAGTTIARPAREVA